MLAKKYRLPLQYFTNKKSRKNIKFPFFILKIFPSCYNFSRFGIIISRKVSKKAVIRNRFKRLIFNFLKENKEKFPAADYLTIIYPEIIKLDKNNLIKELSKLLTSNS